MNARAIQRAIMRERYARSFVIPNFTPKNWWECDVFEVSRAGYFTEYEVKISRSDFKADAAKSFGPIYDWKTQAENPGRRKHDDLANGHTEGPSRFFFVMPRGLVSLDEVPPWAGVIEADDRSYEGRTWVALREVRRPKQLHRVKADPAIQNYAFVSCYWRFCRMFLRDKSDHIESDQP